jgi:hypothetical protein
LFHIMQATAASAAIGGVKALARRTDPLQHVGVIPTMGDRDHQMAYHGPFSAAVGLLVPAER